MVPSKFLRPLAFAVYPFLVLFVLSPLSVVLQVVFGGESFMDIIGKVIHLGFSILFWTTPLYCLGCALIRGGMSGWRSALWGVAAVVVWGTGLLLLLVFSKPDYDTPHPDFTRDEAVWVVYFVFILWIAHYAPKRGRQVTASCE